MVNRNEVLETVDDENTTIQGRPELVVTNEESGRKTVKVEVVEATSGTRVFLSDFGLAGNGSRNDTLSERDLGIDAGRYVVRTKLREDRSETLVDERTVDVPTGGLESNTLVVAVSDGAATTALQ